MPPKPQGTAAPPSKAAKLLEEYKRSKRHVRDIVTEMLRNKDNQLVRSMAASSRHRQILERRIQKLGLTLQDTKEAARLAKEESHEFGETVDLLNRALLHHSYTQPISKELQSELVHRAHITINNSGIQGAQVEQLSTSVVQLQQELEGALRREAVLEQDAASLRHALELVLAKEESTLEKRGKEVVSELISEATQDLQRIRELDGDPYLLRLAEERQRQMAEMSAVKQEIEKLRQDKKNMEQALRKAEQEVVQMRLKMMERDSSMAVVSKKMKVVESKLVDEQSSSNSRIEAAERLAGEITQKYEAELKRCRDVIEETQKKMVEQGKTVDYYKSQVSEAKYEFVRIKKALEKERIEVQTELTQKVKEEKERADAAVKKAEEDVRELADRASISENTLFKRQAEFNATQQRLGELEQRLQEAVGELQQRDEELVSLRRSAMTGDKDVHQMTMLLRAAQERLSDMEASHANERRELEAQCEAREGDLHGAQSRIEALLQERKTLVADAAAGSPKPVAGAGRRKPVKSPLTPALKPSSPLRSVLEESLETPLPRGSTSEAASIAAPPALVVEEAVVQGSGASTPAPLSFVLPRESPPGTPTLSPRAQELLQCDAVCNAVVSEAESRRTSTAAETALTRLTQLVSSIARWRATDPRAKHPTVAATVDHAVQCATASVVTVAELGSELRRRLEPQSPSVVAEQRQPAEAPPLPTPLEARAPITPARSLAETSAETPQVRHVPQLTTPPTAPLEASLEDQQAPIPSSVAETPAASPVLVVPESQPAPLAKKRVDDVPQERAATQYSDGATPIPRLAPTDAPVASMPTPSTPACTTPQSSSTVATCLGSRLPSETSGPTPTGGGEGVALSRRASLGQMSPSRSGSFVGTGPDSQSEKKLSFVCMELDAQPTAPNRSQVANSAAMPAPVMATKRKAVDSRRTLQPRQERSGHCVVTHPCSTTEMVESNPGRGSDADTVSTSDDLPGPIFDTSDVRVSPLQATSTAVQTDFHERATPRCLSADASEQTSPPEIVSQEKQPPTSVSVSTQSESLVRQATSKAVQTVHAGAGAVQQTGAPRRRQQQQLPHQPHQSHQLKTFHAPPELAAPGKPESDYFASEQRAATLPAPDHGPEVSSRDVVVRERQEQRIRTIASTLGVSSSLVAAAASSTGSRTPQPRSPVARRDAQAEAELQLHVMISAVERFERASIAVAAEQMLWEIISGFKSGLLELEACEANSRLAKATQCNATSDVDPVAAFILSRQRSQAERVHAHAHELMALRSALGLWRRAGDGTGATALSENLLREMDALQGDVDAMLQRSGVTVEQDGAQDVPVQRYNTLVQEYKKLTHAFESSKVVEKVHAAMHESTRQRLEVTLRELESMKGRNGGTPASPPHGAATIFDRPSTYLPSFEGGVPERVASHAEPRASPTPSHRPGHQPQAASPSNLGDHVSALYCTVGAFIVSAQKLVPLPGEAEGSNPSDPQEPPSDLAEVSDRLRSLLARLGDATKQPKAVKKKRRGSQKKTTKAMESDGGRSTADTQRAPSSSISETVQSSHGSSSPRQQAPSTPPEDDEAAKESGQSTRPSTPTHVVAADALGAPSSCEAAIDAQSDLLDSAVVEVLSSDNAAVKDHLAMLMQKLTERERELSGLRIAHDSQRFRKPELHLAPTDDWAQLRLEEGLQSLMEQARRRLQRVQLESLMDDTLREGVALALDSELSLPAARKRAANVAEALTQTRSHGLRAVLGHVSADVAHTSAEVDFLRSIFTSFPQAYVEQLAQSYDPDVAYDVVQRLSEWWDRWVQETTSAQRSLLASKHRGLQQILQLCDMLENVVGMVNVEYAELLQRQSAGATRSQAPQLLEVAGYLRHRGRVHKADMVKRTEPSNAPELRRAPRTAAGGGAEVFQLRSRCTVKEAPAVDPVILRRVDRKMSDLRKVAFAQHVEQRLLGVQDGNDLPRTPPPPLRNSGVRIPTVATPAVSPAKSRLGSFLPPNPAPQGDGWKSSTMPLPALSTRKL